MGERNHVGPADPVDVRVGRRVAESRARLGMRAEDLERSLGLSAGSLALYETGRQGIPASVLFRLARSLDVSVADLLDGAAPETLLGDVAAAAERHELERFLRFYRALTDERLRRGLLRVLRLVADGFHAPRRSPGP